ncbi:D-alanyl-D-alanine carboxypeptidase/D-alanyl-D-alanine-endopeptidase (penicillin-binding protein 4) [Nakamurella sp. UYEF19]|uniref:D-alanyl-D-alanine carboxypeptidase/D-alanyl-D-alanine endopeptidase n=1 Tax=Nakamurella sp. UYEF19 TaxID=1756392 RepID=UPI00339903C5
MAGRRSGGRRAIVIVVSLLLVAGAATAGLLFWNQRSKSNSAVSTSTISSVVPYPTISAVDPPVAAVAAKIKPLPVAAGRVPTVAGVLKILGPVLANPGMARYTGVVVDAATGKVLWSKDSATATQPASTMKLLTGAALLTKVDPNSRFTTRVVQGPHAGDVVFLGGGDVTLSARSAGVTTPYDGAPTVSDLAAQVKAKGYAVKRILLDTSYWTGSDLADGWDPNDIAAGNITRMQALMVDGDRKDPATEDSSRTGTPAITAGKALARALGDPNLPVIVGAAAKNAKLLASVQSQPMSVLLSQALLNSDNVLAEALARQVAIALGGAPSFTGASQAIVIALGDLKLDTIGLTMVDGSGLSHNDLAPTALLASVMTLAVTGRVPALRGLLNGLPVAGVSGTLSRASDRFQTAQSKAGIGWVRAKTGSVDFTYALVGYVPDVDGRLLVFALNSNGVISSGPNQSRPAQDAFAAALRTCGCS